MAGWPVEWKGINYTVSPLTVAIKDAFARWVTVRAVRNLRSEAATELEDASLTEAERKAINSRLQTELDIVRGGSVYWSATPSGHIAGALSGKDGQRQLMRLLLGMPTLSEAAVDDLAENCEEFADAMRQATESADPKAKAAAEPSAVPTAASV